VIRRRFLVLGVIVGAALLAFPLRATVHQLIVVPLAYLFWLLDLLYLSLPQVLWWTGVILLVLFVLGNSLLVDIKSVRMPLPIPRRERGKVESLAASIHKSSRGIYFKWLVANRLGKLAYQILEQRERGKPRSIFAPLVGEDWQPDEGLRRYLEKGLHGSFADFPNSGNRYFSSPPKTLLDHDVADAIEFLELQIQAVNSPQSPPGENKNTEPPRFYKGFSETP
jgi:hypothetical protein